MRPLFNKCRKDQKIITRATMAALMILTLLSMGVPALGDVEKDTVAPAGEVSIGQSQSVPSIVVVESDSAATVIVIDVPGVEEDNVTVDGDVFQLLTIAGYDYTAEVGRPQLPAIREIVGIPDGASVQATVTGASSSVYAGYKVYPIQPPALDSGEDSEFVIDADFYSQDAFYPEDIVQIETPGVWRDVSVVGVQVNPVQYNPATGELRVYDHLEITIEYSGGAAVTREVTPRFDRMYRSSILNYDSLGITATYLDAEDMPAARDEVQLPDNVELDGSPVNTEIKLLSIRPSASIPFTNIKPLLDWHKKRGLPYISAVMSEPTTTANIKNTISAVYASHPELEYVLLVGDVDLIPWQSDWDGMPGDYWYACISGGNTPDLYPEVAVGRLTVNNTTELATQINKIINYSDSPPAGSWVDRALLVAHQESAPGKYQGCKEDIRTATYTDGFTFDTAYGASVAQGGDGATNADVTNAINAGRGIVNYRGHGAFGDPCSRPWGQFWGAQDGYCTAWGWNSSNQLFNTATAHALANGNMTPVIFNIACMNNALDNPTQECLGEAFIKDTQSAVAFLGATRPSYTTPNHEFDKFLFDAVGNENIYNIGDVLNDANVELIGMYGTGHIYMENLKMYLWLGDPALELWSAAPRALSVTYPATVQNNITLTVKDGPMGVPNALVCLTKGDPLSPDIYTYAYTDASGQASITFSTTSDGPMNISVTKHNYLPYTGTVSVDTTPPAATVTAPNGGESWGVGEVHNITWTATDVVTNIDILYSDDSGATFPYYIANGLSNSGTYAWTVPFNPSPYCRVKVKAYDGGGLVGEDVSDADFAIVIPDIQVRPPGFNVTLPPDVTWQGNLQISNKGTQALTYNLADVETTGGPYFMWAKQAPLPLPNGGEGYVEAMVNDPDGLGDIDYVKLSVLVNMLGDWAYMHDDGIAPDVMAGDGIYTLTVYGVSGYGEEVSLLLEAKDTDGHTGQITYPLLIDLPDGVPVDDEQRLCGAQPEPAVQETAGLSNQDSLSVSGSPLTELENIGPETGASYMFDGAYLIAVAAGTGVETDELHSTLAEFGLSYIDVNSVAEAEAAGAEVIIGYYGCRVFPYQDIEDYIHKGGGYIQIGDWFSWFDEDWEGLDDGTPVTVTINNPTHPICTGLPASWSTLGFWSYGWEHDAVGWVTDTSMPSIVAVQADGGDLHYRGISATIHGAGRAVYLGFNVYGALAGPDDKLLFLNSLNWVAQPDCPWLDEVPDAGSVPPSQTANIDVNIDTTGLVPGKYSAEIYAASNDTNEDPTILPVQLSVRPPVEMGAILFDETHDPYFTTSVHYQEWVAYLELWGFTVSTATTGPITYDLLSGYCAVIIPFPIMDYTDAEIEAIAAYVNDGGGLLILGENGGATGYFGNLPILNELATPFDMSFNGDTVQDDEHNDGNYLWWPLIPDFDASVAGADVDTVVEYAGCTVNTADAAFPVAWAYDSASTDMGDMGEVLLDPAGIEIGEPAGAPAPRQVIQTEVLEGIDAITGEAPVSEPVLAQLSPLQETDTGGKVMWDLTHGVYSGYEPADRFSMLVEVLTVKGYTVETTSSGILNINLDEYAVLVVSVASAWDSAYTPEEVEVIANFVANGGGLLVMGDNAGCPNANINPVAQQFGTTCGISTTMSGVISNLAAHPIFDGITQFSVSAPGEIEGLPPSTEVAWDPNGYPMVSVAAGSGNVVVVGNVDQWDNGSLADVDNQQFAENVFDWLSALAERPVMMAASQFGSGRAMVIGDGNLFTGDDPDHDGITSFYEYDNSRLALNIIDWLCQAPGGKPDLVVTEKAERLATPQKFLHSTTPLNPMEPITGPVGTAWHELYPAYSSEYNIQTWEDNGDQVLSPSDWIVLEDTATGEMGNYHVDRMTITILVEDKSLAFESLVPYDNVAWAMENPETPFWHLIYPTFCIDHAMTGWNDIDENGLLSAGDTIVLTGVAPDSQSIETTVDEVSWDIVVRQPPEAVVGTYYQVRYTVFNQGTAVAPRGHSATLYVDGAEIEHQVIAPDLEPGESFTVAFRTIVECTGGEDTVIVEADNYNQVDELNEENNRMENTWFCCKPAIEVSKVVWNPRMEQWAEGTCAQVQDIVQFRCVIHNNGECCDLTNIIVGDVLSDSLNYLAGHATVNGAPWEPVEVGPNQYVWNLGEWVLPPSESIVIEFKAVVVQWTEGPDINLQWVTAFCPHPEGYVHAEDTATVRTFIPGDANMDGIIDSVDLSKVLRIILEEDTPTCGADANLDRRIDSIDLVKVLRMILGVEL